MSEAPLSRYARVAQHPLWGALFLPFTLLNATLLMLKVTDPVSATLTTLAELGLIALYYAPARRALRRAEELGAGVLGLIIITVTLWYQTALWVSYASYLTPLFALCFGVIVSATTPIQQLLLILLAVLLEVGFIYNYPISNLDMTWHLALHVLCVLTLPRVLTPRRLSQLLTPSSSAVAPEEVTPYSFTEHLVPLNDEERARARRAPSPLSVSSRLARADTSPHAAEAPSGEGPDEGSGGAALEELAQGGGHSLRPSPVSGSGQRVSISSHPDHRLNPLTSQALAAPAESRELDLGLSTRQLQPFEISAQVESLQANSELRRKRPIDFIDHSCAVMLDYLAHLLSAESAVLIWRRSDGESAVVRWRWTRRSGRHVWSAHPFSMSDPLLAAALQQPEARCLTLGEEGWDGSLPYYVPGAVRAGGVMTLVIGAGQGVAPDGVLCIDRDSDAPWSHNDRFVAIYIAHKLALDLDVSHFMKQLTYDSDLSERLLFSLKHLHSSRSVEQLVRALLDALIVQDSCVWLAVCLARQEGVQVAGAWTARGPSSVGGQVFALGDDYTSESMRLGVSMRVEGAQLLRLLPFSAPELSRLVVAKVIPLIDPEGERFGAVILGALDRNLLEPPYLNTLELVVSEAAEKLSLINAHDRLREQAMTDGLTQLRNHRTFQSDLDQALGRADRAGGTLGLLLLDIDHFKGINDTYGHPFGDAVLRGVAHSLKGAMREVDLVARYGGEEFAVALDLSQDSDALVAAERARAAVERLSFMSEGGQEVRVTISLGLSFYPQDAHSKEALIDRADQALYQAKRRGRNRLVVWREVREEPGLSSGMCTRHPVSVLAEPEGGEASARAELQGINALITPSRGVPRKEEPELSIFNTGEHELLQSRARAADGRLAPPHPSRDSGER